MAESITVLHVDDEPAFLEMAATFLEREHESIAAETTTSVDDALDRLEEGDVDCVVSDLEMPDVDGLEFLESVRTAHPNLPFILFTGKGSEEVASRAITAGVTDYLQKGTGTDQYVVLANRIENAVSQRRAERSLAESERRFRALIEHSQDAIAILDENGALQYVSPTVEDFIGLPAGEILGQNAFDRIHPEERDAVVEQFAASVGGSVSTPQVECRLGHIDGSWRIVHAVGNNRLDDPAIQGFVVNLRDVTEQRRTDHELAETKATIESLYDVAARMEDCTTAEELYVLAVESAEAILAFDLCIVDEVEEEVLVPQAISSGISEGTYYETIPVEEGEESTLASQTFRERESFLVEDLHEAGYAPAKATYQSAISIPVGDRGVFQAVSESPHAFDETDCDAAELLVAHLMANLERIERAAILRRLQEEIDRIRRTDDLDEICSKAVDAARDVLGVPLCGIHLIDDAGEALDPVAVTAEVESTFDGQPPTYTATDANVWEVFEDGEPRIVSDVRGFDQPNPLPTISTLAVFPLGDLGVMIMASKTPDAFEVTDVHFAKLLAAGTEATLIRRHRERELAEHEARLERERNRLTALFENATDAIVFAEFVDGEPIAQAANRAFEETFGYDTAEIVGKSVDDLIVPSESAEEAAEITHRGTQGEDFELEVQRLTVDGPRDFLLRSVPVETGGDSTTGYGVYTDITDRMERERDLERYETLVRAIGDAVYTLDADGHFTAVNDALVSMTGYDRDALLGEHFSAIGSERAVERGRTMIRNLLRDAGVEKATYELSIQTADGETVPVENHIALLPFEETFHGTVGVMRDITSRLEREEELQRQNERLEEFASVVSHDLRNPLTVAQGHLELAAETGEPTHHEKVSNALDRMDRIVEDILVLAREGRTVGETSTVDLEAVARRGWRSVESGTATLTIADDLGSAAAHESRLQRLFENLFRNSVEHGGADVAVEVGPLPDGFFVTDDGPGIPPEAREQAFDFGYSTDTEGTGFGLAIVRQIAEAHDWTVSVGESEAAGARFEVRDVESV